MTHQHIQCNTCLDIDRLICNLFKNLLKIERKKASAKLKSCTGERQLFLTPILKRGSNTTLRSAQWGYYLGLPQTHDCALFLASQLVINGKFMENCYLLGVRFNCWGIPTYNFLSTLQGHMSMFSAAAGVTWCHKYWSWQSSGEACCSPGVLESWCTGVLVYWCTCVLEHLCSGFLV